MSKKQQESQRHTSFLQMLATVLLVIVILVVIGTCSPYLYIEYPLRGSTTSKGTNGSTTTSKQDNSKLKSQDQVGGGSNGMAVGP